MVDRIKSAWRELTESKPVKKEIKAASYTGQYSNVFAVSYDGEKNLGEIGPIKEYWPDYHALRLRSWQAYLESEVAQMVIGKYIKWVIGSGLKLQAEPSDIVLRSEKISLSTQEFSEISEARFSIFAKSKNADYAKQKNLHKIARVAYKNAILGGDVLVILRFIDGQIRVQLIDGCHVRSPFYGTDGYAQTLDNGNTIRHGIELSPTGEHVAYYVCKKDYTFERIPAKVEGTDLLQAFLLYGLEYRLDNHRGLPLISAMLETLKKLERYKEATVGSAEEVAKIAWQVVHQVYSTGENPFADRLAKAFDADATEDLAEDINGIKLANKVAASTNKTAVNNPPGAEVKPITSSNKELYFEPFYNVNIGLVCAAINIPKDVATSQYNGNFSASRAALKDWEHTINTDRCDAPAEFYQNVYNFWLHVQILTNKVNAPGYIQAFQENNNMVLDSYRNSRWVGASVPHIDPLKEVNAERAKLGASGLDIPLTTVEQATEALNGGDSDQNMAQYAEELKESKRLGIQSIIPESANPKKKDGED